MQTSQLNLLTILFQPGAFSRPFRCCDAAKAADGANFYIATFSKRYKLYNAAIDAGGNEAAALVARGFRDLKLKQLRHSRESGNPFCSLPKIKMDPRLRGDDDFIWPFPARTDRFRKAEPNSGAPRRGVRVVRKKTSRPVSRVLSWTVIPLGLTSPSGSSNLPGSSAGHANAPLFGLAPSGVCHATRRCPRARCALTAPFHPYHARLATPFGGLFSVALSVGSRRPGVTWHCALWSPDFPRNACAPRDHPADSGEIVPRWGRGERGEGRGEKGEESNQGYGRTT